MTRRTLRHVAIVVIAFAAALVPLLFLDGDRRTLGFRAYGLVLGLLALRAILGFSVEAGEPPVDSPFAARRWRPLRRRNEGAPKRTAIDHLAASGTSQASGFHFRLRPALRDIADQRLLARHGIGIDEPRAEAVLGPAAHDLLLADRPPPNDRRSPGIDPATLDDLLTTLERL